MTTETELSTYRLDGDDHFNRQLLAAIVDSSFDAIVSKNLQGIVLTWNRAAEQLYGYSAAEMVGQSILALVPAHLHTEEMQILERLRKGNRIEPFETVRQRKDGSYVTVSLTISPIRTAEGVIVGASKIARDITPAKERERRIRLLLREVNHRVKNQYAIILSMIRQSRSTMRDPEMFERQIRERIMALSASHDLLVSGDWAGAGLAELIKTQLRPFERDNLIHVSGPLVNLTPTAVENLGMAFHELAVNSAKYGVLAHQRGRISISWNLQPAEHQMDKFILSWNEDLLQDVPPSLEPRPGFGTIILKRVAPQALNSVVDWDRSARHVRWQLEGPAENFVARASPIS